MDQPNNYQPTERRPIASRKMPIWQKVTTFLVRSKFTANSISIFGMIAALIGGLLFFLTSRPELQGFTWLLYLAAAACVQLRLLANLLDGMVAIESGQASPVGELYNEIPDRVSDSALLIGAGYSLMTEPVWGYTAALAAMFTAYVRAQGKAAGSKQQFCGPMAKPQRMALLTVVAIVCAIFGPVLLKVSERSLFTWTLIVITILATLTAVRRILKSADDLRANKK
jgi:phosphatidylglycerophosphate synthase